MRKPKKRGSLREPPPLLVEPRTADENIEALARTSSRPGLPGSGGKSMTPEQIVERIAWMTDPYSSSEPFDSEQTLARLIQEAQAALSPRRRRRQARMYDHERVAFTRAMLLIQEASADGLRCFASDVVDLLWGEGSGTSKRSARRLDFDKEWEVDTIEEVVSALSRHTFYPFPKG